jgi:hypothetical protein
MTSQRTETTDRPDDSEKESKGTTLSPVQLTAGALSAVSTAVVASFFGVAGTLIGTALASVISTVSATLYSNSLQKTNERLRRVREGLTERQPRVTDAGAAAPATRVLPASLDPRRAPAPRRRPRWGRVAAYAVGVFAIAMGIVTGVELIGQQPVSALVGASQTSGTTTLGALTNAASQRDSTPSTPSSPTTSSTSAPTSPSDGESTEEETESDGGESGPTTPTSSSPESSEEPDEDSSTTPAPSSVESPETFSEPEEGAESTP